MPANIPCDLVGIAAATSGELPCAAAQRRPGRCRRLRCGSPLTGDVKYHQAHHALELGVAMIDAGHYGTERPVLDLLARLLREHAGDALEVHLSRVCTDPFA